MKAVVDGGLHRRRIDSQCDKDSSRLQGSASQQRRLPWWRLAWCRGGMCIEWMCKKRVPSAIMIEQLALQT